MLSELDIYDLMYCREYIISAACERGFVASKYSSVISFLILKINKNSR